MRYIIFAQLQLNTWNISYHPKVWHCNRTCITSKTSLIFLWDDLLWPVPLCPYLEVWVTVTWTHGYSLLGKNQTITMYTHHHNTLFSCCNDMILKRFELLKRMWLLRHLEPDQSCSAVFKEQLRELRTTSLEEVTYSSSLQIYERNRD